jgi:IS5 family transposase
VLLYWFSDEVYRRLLSRVQDHFLLRLAEKLDFAPLEQACADFHHSSGPGATPTHPAPRLVRALLVKYLLDLSFRQLEQAIRWNLLVKWFVGYALFEPGPDHSTLERFDAWVQKMQPRSFFDEVLKQIDQDFPLERLKPQIGDTYALRANAASESLIQLLRHACQRLLLTFASLAGDDELAKLKAQLDTQAIYGAKDERSEFHLETEQRGQRLHVTVVAILHCQKLIRSYLDAHPGLDLEQKLNTWLDILDKIIDDELSIEKDETGRVIAAKELPKNKKGSYRIASATDPDATFRVHGERIDFGYNVNVAATDAFIREIRVDTGSQPDAVAIPDLLEAQQEHHDLVPPKLIYDKAAGTGKTHAEVDEVSDGQTQLVAPLADYSHRNSERFGPDDFILAPDGASLNCPNRQVSFIAYRSQSGEGRVFRFSAQQCADCPLAQACRGDKVPHNRMRQVFISDHRTILAKARTYQQTPQFKLDMKLRPTIERIIAQLVRYFGARHARRCGLDKNDYQAKQNATAFNLRQWLRQSEQRTAALVAAGP